MALNPQAIRAFVWSQTDKLVNKICFLVVTVYLARLIGPVSFVFIGILTISMILTDSVVAFPQISRHFSYLSTDLGECN